MATVNRGGEDSALELTRALLVAPDMLSLAALFVGHAQQTLGCEEATLLWSLDWPHAQVQYPERTLSVGQLALTQAAAAAPDATTLGPDGPCPAVALCAATAGARAVLLCTYGRAATQSQIRPSDCDAFFSLARPCLVSALEKASLRNAVERLEQSEKLGRALFAIADLAGSGLEMPEMLRGLHKIVGSLMYAENFYIALHDAGADTIRFIYFVDVSDSGPKLEESLSLSGIEHGLTWYLIRDGRALMGSQEQLRRQVSGPLHARGPDSLDWLGVPMIRGASVRGALVVQSYVERPRYSAHDQALLSYVGAHILTALERKQAQEELEHRVKQRTGELAKANAVLTTEVQERQRGERLQTALFRIAELSSSANSLAEFFPAVHAIVGELIDATNFYIALISDDRSELLFPYWVDERMPRPQQRKLAKGLTEYVLRTGKPLLFDMANADDAARIEGLNRAGELMQRATDSVCWLGVPLVCAGGVVGVVTVQSYTPEVRYRIRDQELLTFVSSQIANSLERTRAADALRAANAELEHRVAARTRELSEQIAVRNEVELAVQQRNAELESLNRRLAGTQSQLLQSEKMASVGQLAAGVAHEINNPIGYVHSNLTSLIDYMQDILFVLQAYEQLEGTLDAENPHVKQLRALKARIELDFVRADISNLLAESVEGIARVEKIVSDLKDFSHVDDVEWQQADIHAGIESTLNVVGHEIKYKADLVKEYGQLPPIECLPFQLNQVFLNLLVNAAQAIEQRGTISIRTGVEGNAIWVQISDTGTGIDPRHLHRIFEPFFTTKPVGVGTGLGLSVSYGIIKKHGGTIDAASEVGRGSTFTIRLPSKRPKAVTV